MFSYMEFFKDLLLDKAFRGKRLAGIVRHYIDLAKYLEELMKEDKRLSLFAKENSQLLCLK